MRFNPRFLTIQDIEGAKGRLQLLGPSEQGLSIMAPKMVCRSVYVENVDSRAANMLKQNMLSIGGEVSLPRDAFAFDGSQIAVIISGNLKHYRELMKKLRLQPFGLRILADELEQLLDSESAGRILKLGGRAYDLGRRTLIMGVINTTPDSFSDGGIHISAEDAVEHGLRLAGEGADILDVGGESTRPGSDFVSLEEELQRVIPVIEGLAKLTDIPISIDTTKAEVARRGLDAGCAMVNEISAMRLEEDMLPLVVSRNVPVCLMHMQGMPKDMQVEPRYDDVIREIAQFLRERADAAVEAGGSPSNIMIDPGIGFGKALEHNLEIIKCLREFRSLGYPVVLGPSRKSFIGKVLDLPVDERLEGTAAAVALGIANGADMVRVHDVKEMVRVSRIADAIVGKG
ncbi:MAG: dihydropteroate synthase [Actinobacteria bacterium RBG_19FT_COMBO_54_7]|nr:MAG: dihydropteroate synthase [Actinobacteria bacterium RBG_19FT_COMBO_54_7]